MVLLRFQPECLLERTISAFVGGGLPKIRARAVANGREEQFFFGIRGVCMGNEQAKLDLRPKELKELQETTKCMFCAYCCDSSYRG